MTAGGLTIAASSFSVTPEGDGPVLFSALRPSSMRGSVESLELPLWGDGLVDQALTTLWYPSNWNDTCDDELIFLIPSLMREVRGGLDASTSGASTFLRRALCARLRWVALALGFEGRERAPERLLNAVSSTRAMTALDGSLAWVEGEQPFRVLYSSRLRHGAAKNHAGGTAAPREAWIHELSVLTCLDRCLQHSLRAGGITGPRDSVEIEFGVADALIASTYSSVNAAYIYPQFLTFHEPFTVGAWLGNLLRGRPALMPAMVADRFLAGSERRSVESAGDGTECDRLLGFLMSLLGGPRTLVRAARRTRASGYSAVVRGQLDSARLSRSPYVWNKALHDYIDSRLAEASG